jgi:hypothetical protein
VVILWPDDDRHTIPNEVPDLLSRGLLITSTLSAVMRDESAEGSMAAAVVVDASA